MLSLAGEFLIESVQVIVACRVPFGERLKPNLKSRELLGGAPGLFRVLVRTSGRRLSPQPCRDLQVGKRRGVFGHRFDQLLDDALLSRNL